jgi:precorrin-2 dehydrogenase / sirohydrochlorin ferrochelatase
MPYHVGMGSFPIMLNLRGMQAVVVGSGPVGLRKVHSLLEAGASVRLVAPDPPADLPEGVELLAESCRPEHLSGARLVFVCTDDRSLNAEIAADARAAGAWVNAVDQPEDCDFFMPAVHRTGRVVLAVGTGGASPALAGTLRDGLAGALPEHVADFADLLADLRAELRDRLPENRSRTRILRRLVRPEVLEDFARRGEVAVRDRLGDLLDAPPGDGP